MKRTGQTTETLLGVSVDLLLRLLTELDSIGSINLLADNLDFVRDGDVEIV